MREPRFCTDCRFAKLNPPPGLPMACLHPSAPRDPVDGSLATCSSMRYIGGGHCGFDAVLWEPREPVAPREGALFLFVNAIRRAFQ